MGSIADLYVSIQVFIDRNTAPGEADPQGGGLDLEVGVVESDRVVMRDDTLMLDREGSLQIRPVARDKSCALLFGRRCPCPVVLGDPDALQEPSGLLEGLYPSDPEFLRQAALPGAKEALHPAPGLGGVGRDQLTPKLPQGPLDLGRPLFNGVILMGAGVVARGGEVGALIGVEGAKEPLLLNDSPDLSQAA